MEKKEKANRDTFKSIQTAFREALLILPEEEYREAYDVLGKEVQTLAGHIDLESPLEADMLLIR